MISNLGIVAIGRNEGERLVRCLASIKGFTTNIVYVDSGSKDDSVLVARRDHASVVILDPTKPFSAARARNEGFAAVRELAPSLEFVQFIDGDCTIDPGWIEFAISRITQQSDVAVICGRRRERYPAASVYNQLCDLEWNTPVGETRACGGDMLVRVAAFEEVEGFRPHLIAGEEPELCVRLRERGWKIWRLDADMTLHDASMTRFTQWWARTVRCGHAFAEVSTLHRNSPQGIWKRETVRAVLWGGLIPAAICIGTIFYPITALGWLLYIIQIVRVAFARGVGSLSSWLFAFFVTIAKPAEFLGIVKFLKQRLFPRAISLIEYK